MADLAADAIRPRVRSAPSSFISAVAWGYIFLIPYFVVFSLFVFFPIAYGFWLGSDPDSYVKLWNDPIYLRTVKNTLVFVGASVNIQMALALLLSGFFVHERRWIRFLSVIFILPYVIPATASILSVRWMLNPDWGMVNSVLWYWFRIEPPWLTDPNFAMGSVVYVSVWRHMPFWGFVLLAGRLAISKDLYEAAEIDGANGWQRFRFITWPGVKKLYIAATVLGSIWALGEFNSIYLMTGGGPYDATHTLGTVGLRYAFHAHDLNTGVAVVLTAIPIMIPIVFYMLQQLKKGHDA